MEIINFFPLQSLGVSELITLLPLFLISFGAVGSLLAGTHKTKGHEGAFGVAFGALLLALLASAYSLTAVGPVNLSYSLAFTPFTKTLGFMGILFSLLAVLLTFGQDKKEGLLPEVYGLMLFASAGMVLMVTSNHLLFTFIALEIMSLAVYVLVAMRRSSQFSAEAGLKYFILGGLASAFFLYGSALVFGSTATFDLANITQYLLNNPNPSFIYYVGLGLIMAAMLFKVGAVPFHGWVPDVYQGAATNVTGFMGAAVKFTAFLAFANITRHMVFVANVEGLSWFRNFIWLASAASMIYGNFVAISQTEIKRMLSFSTIAHTGYLLMGLYAMNASVESSDSLVLYLFFYALSSLGAFAIIALFEGRDVKDLTLNQLAGIGSRKPFMAGLFTLFLLSMAGIPLTAGFIGKYGLFNSTVVSGEIPLVVIAVLTSVVSVYYYLRVIIYMFMKDATGETAVYSKLGGASLAAIVSAAATLQFGLFPRMVVQFLKALGK